jgi:hypothetical protein
MLLRSATTFSLFDFSLFNPADTVETMPTPSAWKAGTVIDPRRAAEQASNAAENNATVRP